MTTDYMNITKIGVQPLQSRQLPSVTNTGNQQKEADNIVLLNVSKRQEIAETNGLAANTVQNNESDNDAKASVLELNNSNQIISRNLEFQIDQDSGRTIITVRDTKSKEVIRQIPSEQLLEISSRLKELQESNLENEQAAGILFTSKT